MSCNKAVAQKVFDHNDLDIFPLMHVIGWYKEDTVSYFGSYIFNE